MNEFDLIAQAKQRLPLSALMAQLGFGDRAKKSARCPFHEDSSASFSLYVGDDGEERWKCFAGCGQGDAIDFLAKHRGLNNADACREYIRLADVPPPPAPPSSSNPSPSSQPPFDWQSCVAALTPEHRANLAKWRGYAPKFVEWLHAENLVGLFDGERIAFPVHDAGRNVIGCHYRLKEDGSWRYHPTGTRTAPFIIGDLATAKTIFDFESQWDLLAVLDCLHHHIQPLAYTAAVATRGAGNARLLAGLCAPDAVVYAFGQNDEAGTKWLAAVAANSGRKTFHVVTPAPHKDANDWTHAGATADEIRAAIAAAQPVAVSTAPDLHAAPPKKVSNPAITLPLEDENTDSPPAPFPLDAMPPKLALLAAGVARTARVPDRLTGPCVLGLISAAIGAGLEVQSDTQRTTRGNLFLLVSAETGTGKSRTFEIIAVPMLDYQERLQEHWRKESAPHLQSELKILDREIANLEKKAGKTVDTAERERLRGELEYKIAERDELARRNVQPVLLAQDATTERLTAMVEEQGEVLFSASSDCRKVVDNLMGRYSANKSTDESFYLAGYSGDHVRVDRGSRPPVNLRRPCLGLLWFGQPDLVESMLAADSLRASGFLPRLLLCHSHAVPQRIEGEPEIISESILADWSSLVSDLLGSYHQPATQHVLQPTPEARQRLVDYHNAIVERRHAELRDVTGFAARWAEQAWRLAVVLHAGLHGTEAHTHPLDSATAENAVRLADWFADEQLDILAKGRHEAARKIEEQVLEHIQDRADRQKIDYTTAREVHRARITATADAAKALLAQMETDGLLVAEGIAPAHGGKTTRIYRAVKNPVPE
ncbi:MAG: DUF3987 domain-containing protein [Limisphaerales bacterium]